MRFSAICSELFHVSIDVLNLVFPGIKQRILVGVADGFTFFVDQPPLDGRMFHLALTNSGQSELHSNIIMIRLDASHDWASSACGKVASSMIRVISS